MKDDHVAIANQYARLYVRGQNKDGKTRYLACDPAYTDELWTWTTKMNEAHSFSLDRLPELLRWVRHRKGGYAVKLMCVDGLCTLAERDRIG